MHAARRATGRTEVFTYHSLLGKPADLLDRPGGPLLEADTVDLLTPCISLMLFFSLPPDTHRESRTNI
jgi:hypothetical protein